MYPCPIKFTGHRRPNLSRIDRPQHQWVEPSPSIEATPQPRMSFGLSSTTSAAENVEVAWREGSGEPVRDRGWLARRPQQPGRLGRTQCRISTDGSSCPPTSPTPTTPTPAKPTARFSASGRVATSSRTTTPTTTGDSPVTRMCRAGLVPPAHGHRPWWSSATASMCRASPAESPRCSLPSACSSTRSTSSPFLAPRASAWRSIHSSKVRQPFLPSGERPTTQPMGQPMAQPVGRPVARPTG